MDLHMKMLYEDSQKKSLNLKTQPAQFNFILRQHKTTTIENRNKISQQFVRHFQ